MIRTALAIAGAVLSAAVSTQAADSPVASALSPSQGSGLAETGPRPRSQETLRVANWVAVSRDNRALPYIIIDKNDATAVLFDAKGKLIPLKILQIF